VNVKSFISHVVVRKVFLGCALGWLALSASTAYAVSNYSSFAVLDGSRIVLVSTSTEDPAVGAQKFIDSMAQKALDFLGNEKLSYDEKANEFRKLLQDSFDMDTIGRYALGRYWRVATPEERKEYQKLFRNMVVEVYSDRFRDYEGQHVETRSARADGNKDTIVTSFIVPEEGAEIQVDWRVRYKKGHYQIVDVVVEGVSMSVTQRSDFSSVIQRGGGDIQVLISHLKQ